MVSIELRPEHLEILAELVEGQLTELRAELRRTENHEFRARLKERQAQLQELNAQLEEIRVPGRFTPF